MKHLNRRIIAAIVIVVVAVAAFAYMLAVLPPGDGGLGTLIESPARPE